MRPPRAGRPRRRLLAGLTAFTGLALLSGAVWIGLTHVGTAPETSPIRADAGHAAAISTAAQTVGPHGDDVAPIAEVPVSNAADAPIGRWSWDAGAPLAPAALVGYQWPIHGARITNGFGIGHAGSFEVDGVTTHDGIDLSTFCGDRIVAAHDGVVLVAGRHHEGFIGWIGDLTAFRARLDAAHAWSGQAIAVVIDDGNGYRSMYVHLGKAVVKAGDVVHAGQLLGYEGATGNATGCHLHYGLFSPLERGWLALEPKIAAHDHLPTREIARIDPLLVLPPLDAAGITWGWGASTTR